ncbi:MAG: hypothetical protein HQ481_09865 [Alphaproteobacteria bacterium]|nr:hypothetical protein [Alphaproteobacteria bacterium]
MVSTLRIALIGFALLVFAGLPVAAQTSSSTSPTESSPAAAGNQGTAAESPANNLDTTVQRLKQDVQRMGEVAREKTQQMMDGETVFMVTTSQLAAIAAGAVLGAVVFDLLGGGGLATMTGAVVGGFAGHWIYTQPAPPVAGNG